MKRGLIPVLLFVLICLAQGAAQRSPEALARLIADPEIRAGVEAAVFRNVLPAAAKAFVEAFWRDDHFGEYVHPERGLVDSQGLSDVNWAAVTFGLATGKKLDLVWARLTKEPAFWWGGMPTQIEPAPFAGSRAGDEREIESIALRWCPPGRFLMGSPLSEPDRRPDEAQVEVTLTRGFWMSQYEVTQGQWKRIVGALPGGVGSGEGDDLPVHSVNYTEAGEFCHRLTARAQASGEMPSEWEFRLPTEAQWEYACRAGTTTATAFGDKLSSRQANFAGKPYNGAEEGPDLKRAVPVGRYAPNAWGLYDMHGNVFEWCRDWYHSRLPGGDDPDLSSVKGTMNRDGTYSRVRRGGAWNDDGMYCRSAFRLRFEPERRSDHIGFRVAAVRK